MKKVVEEIEVVELKKFYVTPIVKIEGYAADIDGKRIVVLPEIKGRTMNPLTNSAGYGVITESKCYTYDLVNSIPVKESQKEFEGYFEGLSKEQERQLLIAGVIK